ncbi:MAG: CoA transferase subunit A [Candidatus Jordarchaeum sp.]|uniref:CoA transferase subunit A n=1 Tax=Candidatus Jordarchaeum sp. TaxID=2823881 RepID=UPI004049493D
MVEPQVHDKVMATSEAVKKFVSDGEQVCIGNFLQSSPFALIHEIIRQKKKNLILWSTSLIEEADLLIAGGCLKRIVTAFSFRAGGTNYGNEFERALKEKRVEVEDYSNYSVLAMLMAGAMGQTFMQIPIGLKYSDVFRKRSFMGENKFKEMECPFTGKKVLLVPAANPDVAIVHVQRVDVEGNAQLWGALGTAKWASLACKKIIVSAEEIVDHEIIERSPHHTIIPSFRVNAVVLEPWGAHPAEVHGYYDMDFFFRGMIGAMNWSHESIRHFLFEWVYNLEGRQEYIAHYIERFGKIYLERLKAKPYYSVPVNYGSSFRKHMQSEDLE